MSKVLIVNKFLYPNGGSETYIFELGKQLEKEGCQVQYFGMQDERNVVGNAVGSYTSNMDFHGGKLSKLLYPFKIIYSVEARIAIRKVLDDFSPDVVHLNNFNFQITPSVIFEIRKYEKQSGKKIKIIFTAHDYQLVCPNHMMRCPKTGENCSRCIDGAYLNCVKGSCIHGSKIKSVLGAVEGYFYSIFKAYDQIDTVICPSRFIKEQLDHNPQLKGKTIWLQNFTTVEASSDLHRREQGLKVQGDEEADRMHGAVSEDKKDYVVYFGRYSKEKGIGTLVEACRELPEIKFVFAGKGPLEDLVNKTANIENRGFLNGKELEDLIRGAKFSVYPSEWYENCPFSVMESIQYGTPVLGADIGGIPELIEVGVTGELFESGNVEALKDKIWKLWHEKEWDLLAVKKKQTKDFLDVKDYVNILVEKYGYE